jgi:hypothetical protein
MRDEAPHVLAWLGRMWAARASQADGSLTAPGQVPDDWRPILMDIGGAYLPYLNANARAFQAGETHYSFETDGTRYHLPVHRYRVWCLERLQQRWAALAPDARDAVGDILAGTGCLETLAAVKDLHSGFDPDHLSPFFKPGHIWSDKKQTKGNTP